MVPVVGEIIVLWVWGGFVVGGATLRLFFVLHFILPFILLGVVVGHLIFLHKRGRRRILLLHRGWGKIPFFPYY